jgi:hypothetical protein
MPLLLRNLILVFIMLWLPLQGFAATSMSVCQHNEQPAQQAQHDMMHAVHDVGSEHHGHDQHPAKGDLSCDNCAMCHMCGAMGIPAVSAALNIKPASLINTPALTRFSQVYLEQPQRPPLVLSI